MQKSNKEMLHKLIDEVINNNKVDLIEELFSPELVQPVKQAFTSFRAAFPDWREEIVDFVAEDDKIAVRFRCIGTFNGNGTFMDASPTGKKMDVEEVFFLKIKDGHFIEYWGIEDNFSRMKQLGILP